MAFIKIRGILVDILVEISPDVYKYYVSKDKKGSKQLLVQCQNALYGTMAASLLYYRKFVNSLTDIDFVINPYDPCVANNMIKGDQMTICFHVDYCKLSHRWCPTGDMIGEYATKPLQGALFRKFRDQIMGVTPARDPGPGKTDGGFGKTEKKAILRKAR
jgi:hypothetical protein